MNDLDNQEQMMKLFKVTLNDFQLENFLGNSTHASVLNGAGWERKMAAAATSPERRKVWLDKALRSLSHARAYRLAAAVKA